MQTLIVKTQHSSQMAWFGPTQPTFTTYPVWTDERITEAVKAELVARYEQCLHHSSWVVEARIHDDGMSADEYYMRQREADRAERLRCTPVEWS